MDWEYKENTVTSEVDNVDSGQFQCRICDKFLKSKRYLLAHMQEHYGGGYR